jgi:hypothetical protein
MLLVLFFSLTLSQAFGESDQINYYLFLDALKIRISAPEEAKAGEEFKVIISVESSYINDKVYVNSLTVLFTTQTSIIYKDTLLYQQYVEWNDLAKTYTLKTNELGISECQIEVSYTTSKGTSDERSYSETLRLGLTDIVPETREELYYVYSNYTWLKSDYERLKSMYEASENSYKKLNEDYWNLYNNYTQLQTDYNSIKISLEQENETNKALLNSYNYEVEEYSKLFGVTTILFLTTIIFLASTVYLILKVRRK